MRRRAETLQYDFRVSEGRGRSAADATDWKPKRTPHAALTSPSRIIRRVSRPGEYGIESLVSRLFWRPAYWLTLCHLRRDRSSVTSAGDRLRFSHYPFVPATIFPGGTIGPGHVAEVNLSPLQVRLGSGEILFVPYPNKAALLSFVNRNDVQVVRRISVWGALLDPFLDSWQDQETIERQFAWFASSGLDREAVDGWRREVAVAMYAYNFGTMLWEWGALDFRDVLTAQQARLRRAAFRDFYWRAMQVAALDPVQPPVDVGSNTMDSALQAVLLDWHGKHLQEQLGRELHAAYSEPHRRYHTVQHIEFCLRELSRHWAYAIHLNEVRWALLFHDAIYDPRRNDNEARSADWACRVMQELQRPADEVARVRSMILATAHAAQVEAPDEALLLDIDLSILGADAATFDDYDRAIRVEYEWVAEEAYRLARGAVLQGFLGRQRIFQTAAYRDREADARGNIERALQRLRQDRK
jgi:predicted metal-dependent HD superfamily phosphohydrolase